MMSFSSFVSAFILIGSILQGVSYASPLPEVQTTAKALHGCSVFVQRWTDNSFDIYAYSSTSTPPCSLFNSLCPQVAWVSVGTIAVNTAIPNTGPAGVPGNVGSYPLKIVNTANPPTGKGGGSLSFSWGTQSWTSAASTCVVVADPSPYATTTSCTFSCDA